MVDETLPPQAGEVHEAPPDPLEAGKGKDRTLRSETIDTDFPVHWKSGSLKYTDFEPLTEGGTAELQTCLDVNLGRTVVYKSLHPHLQDDEDERRRFVREARVTARIPHTGTVPLYELGRSREGHLFFTMKKLEGQDLRQVIMNLAAKHRPTEEAFPLPRLVDAVIAACQTVGFAHRVGVIHRDLKPANILVGEFGEVMVLDWGLAKVKGEPLEEAETLPAGKEAVRMELTQPGRRYGTPLYMSPEQALGDPDLDERTDVYNLGSVLYECLTKKNLVWGNDVEECLEQITERPTPRPSAETEDEVPRELEAICLKALAREPGDRYAGVMELAEDLVRYRSGEEVSVCPMTWLDRLERFQTRHAVALAAGVALALGLLIGWLWGASS